MEDNELRCIECSEEFEESFLLRNYDYMCCDGCRAPKGKHLLIAKTNAKKKYILQDTDFEAEPQLRFILSHNFHHGTEMRYYMKIQVEEKAVQKWGSLNTIQQEKDLRGRLYRISQINKRRKEIEMKTNRALIRGGAIEGERFFRSHHQHQFGRKTYNIVTNTYSHTCRDCGVDEIYEAPQIPQLPIAFRIRVNNNAL